MRRWISFVPVLIPLLLLVFLSDFRKSYFEIFEKPKLIADHFVAPAAFSALEKSRVPSSFVLAKSDRYQDLLKERYVGADGSTEELTYLNGKWISTSSECQIVELWFAIAVVGFLCFVLGAGARGFRTGEWHSVLSWRRIPFTRRESLLVVYGGSIFLATILIPQPPCIF